MKIRDFRYRKKNEEEGDYSVMILNETDTHLAGIDLKKLSEGEVAEVKAIQEEYESQLKPYMKAYRSFIKERLLEEESK